MSGYLQRLVESAAPATEPPPLAPVVKSTSPVFEQDQLFGLPGLDGGDVEAEMATPVLEDPGPQGHDAPAARSVAPALPRLDVPQPDPSSVPPPLDAQIGRPVAASTLAPRPTTAEPISPPEPPSGPAFEPAMAEAEVEPAPRLDPAPRAEAEQAVPPAASPALDERVLAPVPIEQLPNEPEPAVAYQAAPHAEPGAPAPIAVREVLQPGVAEAPRVLEPVEPAPEAPPPASVLEPRPRPDFREVEPAADQGEPAPSQAPWITIGRVTVELVPDPAPVARSAPPARTAAAASVIGPLGNRRMRRRLFALSRL